MGPIIVVGLSVAGIAAATRLVQAGRLVQLVEIENDLALRERFLVGPTQLVAACSGEEAEFRAIKALRSIGVALDSSLRFDALGLSASGLPRVGLRSFLATDRVQPDAAAVVMAPNGLPKDHPFLAEPMYKEIVGFTLSTSAWADAAYFAKKNGVVIGDTAWVFEQACQAAKYLASVHVITSVSSIECSRDLGKAVQQNPRIRISYSATVSHIVSAGRFVEKIEYRVDDESTEQLCEVLFVASEVVPPWHLVGRRERQVEFASNGLIHTCGIYNSIRSDSDAELEADGLAVANRILTA